MNTDHTLEEVGKVRRHASGSADRSQALRKLRHPSRSEQLRSFIEERASIGARGRAETNAP
jgi:RNA polymerase primary sigma factor